MLNVGIMEQGGIPIVMGVLIEEEEDLLIKEGITAIALPAIIMAGIKDDFCL